MASSSSLEDIRSLIIASPNHSSNESLILRGERLLDEVLKEELRRLETAREGILQEIMQLDTLRQNLELIRDQKIETLSSLIPVGCDVYMEAHIEDTSRIFVEVGFQFFVEFTVQEALSFVPKRRGLLEEKLTSWAFKIADQKSRIQMVLQAISRLVMPAD